MKLSVLASGSTGNSIFIESDRGKILVDVGLTCKRIEGLLGEIDESLSDIDAIFISHEHIDHVKGLKVIANKYQIPIYANRMTFDVLEKKNVFLNPELKMLMEPMDEKDILGMHVNAFNVSHDAVNPQFYTFSQNNKKISVITDTGYVSDQMKGIIKDSNVFVFESNHDVDMLRMCRYPWVTKQRIMSDVGHVSNEDAAHAMRDVITDRTKRIYLSHLSQENNLKELARMNVEQVLNQYDIDTENDVLLHDTDKAVPTKIYEL